MNSDKKIVTIIPYRIFPAKLGGEKGIALFNKYLCRHVSLLGITTRNNDPVYAPDYTLLNILSNSRLRYINILLYFRVKKILLAEKASYLLTEHPYYGWLAWMLRKTLPIRWVVHSHNIEYMRSKSIGRWWWKALKWYEGWAYRKADKVFFISDDDRQHAIDHLKCDPLKSIVVTYGIEASSAPADRPLSRHQVCAKHSIGKDEKIFLFNGALYHSTNYDALQVILEKINPLLLAEKNFRYKIIVCGKGLPEFFNELKEYSDKNIIYAGFVDDVSVYFKAADVFLNPILSGGGVKTKAIEAMAMGCTVVSTELGAMGIRQQVCGDRLHVVGEGEWEKFGELVLSSSLTNNPLPDEFFEYYYWGNIIKKVINSLSS